MDAQIENSFDTYIDKFRKNIRVLERGFMKSLEEQSECCGVTLSQCHVLLEIENDAELTLTLLSEKLGLDKSTVSRTVDSLVRMGYIMRAEAADDRRCCCLSLTQKGTEKVKYINDRCNTEYKNFFNMIPVEKRESIIETLDFLSSRLFSLSTGENGCKPAGCCAKINETGKY